MKLLITVVKILISWILGFGFWYFIGLLMSSNFNPLEWSIFGKIFYILLSWGTTRTIFEYIEDY
jgi:hypothetical protein